MLVQGRRQNLLLLDAIYLPDCNVITENTTVLILTAMKTSIIKPININNNLN
jgi:hypothetical protein